MKPTFIVCRFDSAEYLAGKKRTYAAVKAAVLDAGRFSVFEATASNKNASLFTRLCKDPEIEVFDLPYPWTGVRRRGVEYHGDDCMCPGCCYARKHPQIPRKTP